MSVGRAVNSQGVEVEVPAVDLLVIDGDGGLLDGARRLKAMIAQGTEVPDNMLTVAGGGDRTSAVASFRANRAAGKVFSEFHR